MQAEHGSGQTLPGAKLCQRGTVRSVCRLSRTIHGSFLNAEQLLEPRLGLADRGLLTRLKRPRGLRFQLLGHGDQMTHGHANRGHADHRGRITKTQRGAQAEGEKEKKKKRKQCVRVRVHVHVQVQVRACVRVYPMSTRLCVLTPCHDVGSHPTTVQARS